jgi:hypothetical protein
MVNELRVLEIKRISGGLKRLRERNRLVEDDGEERGVWVGMMISLAQFKGCVVMHQTAIAKSDGPRMEN